MNKAYSNKALPAGTVLREWRLEDVLGVGGFGIVYRGRGIYFDELVAIKEYFPSSISERDAEDTVVPIDSDAEEVHALGLKKFVEEAKLLWNLSTPTRHPNIVSVRSLFEIHGTAYMVMDFEDGMALSKLLKKGQKFNERSLWNIVRPIAEGLARAHRVGVLHRDIKPANILINEDGRPVLIDFGSARFEAAEATSTKVTFHTPPYAAIEQYVKTYPQGPWTDIYALGVVLYECVTGEKPPEVLERLHGGLGNALAGGKWPGYSKKFLEAIDAAMTIRPNERPQSITEWLALFGDKHDGLGEDPDDDADDATRFFAHQVETDEIKPVAPPEELKSVETKVPTDTREAEFKLAGRNTGATRKKKAEELAVPAEEPKDRRSESLAGAAAAAAALTADTAGEARAQPLDKAGEGAKVEGKDARPADKDKNDKPADKAAGKKSISPLLAGGAALVLVAAVAGGWALFGDSSDNAAGEDALVIDDSAANAGVLNDNDVSDLAAAAKTLSDDAQAAGAPAVVVSRLTSASEELARQVQSLQAMANDPAQANAVAGRTEEIKRLAMTANTEFAGGLLRDAEARSRTVAADLPWTDVTRPNLVRTATPAQRAAAARIGEAMTALRAAADATAKAPDPAQSLSGARQTLAQLQAFASASQAAYGLRSATTERAVEPTAPVAAPKAATPATKAAAKGPATKTAAPVEEKSSSGPVTPAKISQLNGIVDDARGMARQVIRMGSRGGTGADVRRANARLARSYDSNLATLKDSARGVSTNREMDRLIAQARQTRAYVQFLLKQSQDAQ